MDIDYFLERRRLLASGLAALTASSVLPGERLRGEQEHTSARRDVPWLAEIQRPAAAQPAEAVRLAPLLVDREGRKITTLDQWQVRRRQIGDWWQQYLRPLAGRQESPPTLTVLDEERLEGVVRQLVRYEGEPGVPTEAYLLRPAQQGAMRPGVLVLHSTVNHSIRQPAGIEGQPEKAFGWKFAQQGMVAFCPRNFLWPENGRIAADQETRRFHQRHPDSKGMAKMLFDAQVALDILAGLEGVDSRRLAAVGHSLGAKEVLYLAAFDERVKVSVSSEGGVGTKMSNWDALWYLGPEIHTVNREHEHHELLALVAPRPFLLIGGNSADGDQSWPFIEAALNVYRLYEPDRRPRLGLLNHGKGHSLPPEAEKRIDEWLAAYI